MNFFKTKIRNKIAILPVSAVVCMSIFSLIYSPANKKTELQKVMSDKVTATADLLAFGLGVALDSDRFDAIAEGFNVTKKIGDISYILIFDNAKKFLSEFNPDSIAVNKTRSEFSEKPAKNGKYLEKASSIKFGKQSYGTVVVGLSLSSVDANVRATFLLLLAIGIGFVVLSVLVALVFSSRIVKPLESVQNAMKALGCRDLTKHCKVETADETAIMAASVNTAIDSLRESISVTSEGTGRISKSITTLSSVSEIMTTTFGEMADKSQSMSKTISTATSRIDGIKQSSNEVTIAIQTIASSIEQMNASLNEVANNCGKESQMAASASTKAGDAQSVMEKLGIAANKISNVTNVIDEIAQQTNLLALNATIEAANAGSAGKGFAIVAQEVKALSRKTAEATGEIASQIEDIQSRSKNAITAITDISVVINEIKTISHSIAAAVEEQSSTMASIAGEGGKTSNNAESISNAVAQWAEEMAHISSGVNAVDCAAKASASGAGDIEESVKELRQLSTELTNNVKLFTL